MLTTHHAMLRPVARRALLAMLASAAAMLALALPPAAPLHPNRAHAATEPGQTEMQAQPGTRSLRLGLQKGTVLRLPAAAKDVIVGNPEIVDVVLKNRNTAYLFARAPGQTNIFFVDPTGRQILQLDLEVSIDTKALKALIDRAIPGNGIQVDSTGANVVLKGTVLDTQQGKNAEDLAQRFMTGNGGGTVLNLLKVAEGNQVMLKVRVVEFKRDILKRLGVDLGGRITAGPFDILFANTTQATNTQNILQGAMQFYGPPVDLTAKIDALESTGLATVLAEPTLTAISGAPASFNAGGEYPYSNCQADNAILTSTDCSISFRNYGIILNFTPTVLAENRIALNVYTEVSELAVNKFDTGGQPIIDTRNAQTSVELPSGGSMMLAGLIKNSATQSLDGTPGLRSLPMLGSLFSSQQFTRNQSELVVIVTPFIVTPADRHKLATPIDHFNYATDLQQLFLGRLNKVYGLPGGSVDGTYHGQVGHIVD